MSARFFPQLYWRSGDISGSTDVFWHSSWTLHPKWTLSFHAWLSVTAVCSHLLWLTWELCQFIVVWTSSRCESKDLNSCTASELIAIWFGLFTNFWTKRNKFCWNIKTRSLASQSRMRCILNSWFWLVGKCWGYFFFSVPRSFLQIDAFCDEAFVERVRKGKKTPYFWLGNYAVSQLCNELHFVWLCHFKRRPKKNFRCSETFFFFFITSTNDL